MQLFYAYKVEGDLAYLDEEESGHCTKTLRKKIGDVLSFTDGCGGMYEGKIVDISKKNCQLQILKKINQPENFNTKKFKIHIAIAPTKNIDRLEWFLEKATEIGIDEISLILCQRSERKQVRLDRLEKIIVSAAKQSLKSHFPKINDLIKFKDFITKAQATHKSIAHCNTDNLPQFKNLIQGQEDLLILIGPEGDFSLDEVKWAKEKGFVEVGLGTSRLRTETAGIVACHTAYLILNS